MILRQAKIHRVRNVHHTCIVPIEYKIFFPILTKPRCSKETTNKTSEGDSLVYHQLPLIWLTNAKISDRTSIVLVTYAESLSLDKRIYRSLCGITKNELAVLRQECDWYSCPLPPAPRTEVEVYHHLLHSTV